MYFQKDKIQINITSATPAKAYITNALNEVINPNAPLIANPNANGQLVYDLSTILKSEELAPSIDLYDLPYFKKVNAIQNYTLNVQTTPANNQPLTVAPGGLYGKFLPNTIAQPLTFQPFTKKVDDTQPEWWAYLITQATPELSLICQKFEAGQPDSEVNLHTYTNLQANEVILVNWQNFSYDADYYKCFLRGQNNTILSPITKFVMSNQYTDTPIYLMFRNRLGFLDTLRTHGAYTIDYENTAYSAETEAGIQTYYTETFKKLSLNTGNLEQSQAQWLAEELSLSKEFFQKLPQGGYLLLTKEFKTLTAINTAATQDNLKLDFRYAETLRN